MGSDSTNSQTLFISWPSVFRNAMGGLLGILISVFMMHGLVQLGKGEHSGASSVWISLWMEIKRDIASKTESPKLIILGGSNAFFGLRAGMLSKELGCPVVNLATHAALPSAFHFHEVDRFIKQGDVILYIPEYEKYRQERYGHNTETASFLISYSQDYLNALPLENYLEMLFSLRASDYLGHFFKGSPFTEKQIKKLYKRHTEIISKNGDYLANRFSDITPEGAEIRKNVQPVRLSALQDIDFSSVEKSGDFIDMIISQHDRLEASGVTLMFSWPNTLDAPEHHSKQMRAKFEEITALLRSHGIVIVGDPYSAMSTKEEFFDSPYHLMDKPAERRTVRLVPSLREALSEIDFPMRTSLNN